jgi:hypothetical protein
MSRKPILHPVCINSVVVRVSVPRVSYIKEFGYATLGNNAVAVNLHL